MLTAKEILKRGGYFIKYSAKSKESAASLYVSWLDKTYEMGWKNGIAYEHFNNDQFIRCSKIVAPFIINKFVMDICGQLKYPYEFVIKEIDNKETPDFLFGVDFTENEHKQYKNFERIATTMLSFGFNNDIFNEAKKLNLTTEMEELASILFNIKLKI